MGLLRNDWGHTEGSKILLWVVVLYVVSWVGWGLGISVTLLCVQAAELWGSWPLG